MLKAVVFGVVAGVSVQSWRQWPPDGPVSHSSAVWLTALAVVCAYLAGRVRRPSQAVADATAIAKSEAHAAAVGNVVNVHVGQAVAASAPVVDETALRPAMVAPAVPEEVPWRRPLTPDAQLVDARLAALSASELSTIADGDEDELEEEAYTL